MIRIAIVDDEEIAIEKATIIMKECLDKSNVSYSINSYTDPFLFLKDYSEIKFQVLFIDIDMPKQSGFDISEKIREINNDLPIIYITNRNDLVYKAFQYKAIGFIRKEYIDKELPEALSLVLKEINQRSNEISINYSGKLYKISVDDIVYIHSEDHNVHFHINKQDTVLKSRSTLTAFSETAEFSKFIPISASCLVNFSYIFSIEKDCILLKNNEKLYIPRRRIKDVKENFLRMSRGGLL